MEHNTQEPHKEQLAQDITQDDELQQLMQMPINQIDTLPIEKQEMIQREFARRMEESPEVMDALSTIAQIGRKLSSVIKGEAPIISTDGNKKSFAQALQEIMDIYKPFIEEMKTTIEAARKEIASQIPNVLAAFDEAFSKDAEITLETLAELAPYIDAEFDENRDKYSNTDTAKFLAAAAQRAHADGKMIPVNKITQSLQMFANDPNKEPQQLSFIEDTSTQKPAASPRRKRTRAHGSGTLTTIGERLLIPSDPEYRNALLSNLDADIGIFIIEALTDNIKLAENGLQLSFVENGLEDFFQANELINAKPLRDIDTGFLQAMAKAAYLTKQRSDSKTTSFYLPAFCDELNIIGTRNNDTNSLSRTQARFEEALRRIHQFDNVWGKLPQENSFYRVFSIIEVDLDNEIVTVAMPYFNQLITAIEKKRQRLLDSGKKFYIGYSQLLYASAVNEKNHAAVEMATKILIDVQNHGATPDNQRQQNKNRQKEDGSIVTYRITCKELINSCPQMAIKLEEQPTTGGRNKMMQRAFTTMYKILREKSDLFSYYKDVKITEIIPTSKTIGSTIYITHRGLNPNYKTPIIVSDSATID